MTQKRQNGQDDGFTLVELLVTMLIVGLLVAIAVPVFLSQRSKSYQAVMQADLHNAIVAETAYSAGHNQVLTTNVADLVDEGYRQTTGDGVAHVKLVSSSAFVACVKHSAATTWLVYDSTTGSLTKATSDCAA